MTNISNWERVEPCETNGGSILDNDHIVTCHISNEGGEKGDMNKILNGRLEEMHNVLPIWRRNLKKKERQIFTSGFSINVLLF